MNQGRNSQWQAYLAQNAGEQYERRKGGKLKDFQQLLESLSVWDNVVAGIWGKAGGLRCAQQAF